MFSKFDFNRINREKKYMFVIFKILFSGKLRTMLITKLCTVSKLNMSILV